MKDETTRAAVYCRVSTEEAAGDDKLSMPRQKSDCLAACQQRDWDVVDVFEDPGLSGTLFEGRPGLMGLLDLCRRGEVNWVVCRATDRLWRGEVTSLKTRLALKAAGVGVWTLDSGEEPLGKPFESVKAALDVMVKEIVVENLARGRRQAAEAGRWVAGQSPYGYDWDKKAKRLVVNEAEARIVALIFDLYVIQGKGTTEIANHLNALGVPTKQHGRCRRMKNGGTRANSGKWRRGGVQRVLTCTAYIGQLSVYKYRKGLGETTATALPKPGEEGYEEGTHLRIECPAIIDEGLWVQAQQIRQSRRRLRPGNTITTYLLTRVAVCGECGGWLGGFTERRRGPAAQGYRCNGRAARKKSSPGPRCTFSQKRADALDAGVKECVRAWAENDKALAEAANVATGSVQQREALDQQVEWAEERLRGLRGERERVRKSYNREITTLEDLEADLQGIEAQEAAVTKDLEHAQTLLRQQEHSERTLQQARGAMSELLLRGVDNLDAAGWRQLFEVLGLRVIVSQDGGFRLRANLPDLEEFQQRHGADVGPAQHPGRLMRAYGRPIALETVVAGVVPGKGGGHDQS